MDRPLISLNDERHFLTLNGLWKGKSGRLEPALVIRNTNFRNDGRLDLTDVAALEVETRQLASRRLAKGDILVERSGGGPKQPVGRVCYFDEAEGMPYSFSNFTSVIRIRDASDIDPRYVHLYLLGLYHSQYTVPLQHATTGIRNLDWNAYLKTEIPLPTRREQARVADVLLGVLRSLEREERALDLLAAMKQASMHKLFTQGLRGEPPKDTELGPVPHSWEVVRLGALGRIGNGSTPKRSRAEYWNQGTIPWLNSGRIHDRVVVRAEQFVTEAAERECHLPRVPAGSLLVAITGQGKTLGNVALTTFETTVSQHLAYLAIERDLIDARFLRHYLASRYEDLRAIGHAGGSTKGAITCAALREFAVPLPGGSEQIEMAETFDALEGAIDAHYKKRGCLEETFKALLNQLLTGSIGGAEVDSSLPPSTAEDVGETIAT